jgi:hypothetical protein
VAISEQPLAGTINAQAWSVGTATGGDIHRGQVQRKHHRTGYRVKGTAGAHQGNACL